jgi:hypothetical protein
MKDTFPNVIGATVMALESRFSLYELTTSLVPLLLVLIDEPRYSKLPIVVDFVCGTFEVCAIAAETISGEKRRTAQTILVDILTERRFDGESSRVVAVDQSCQCLESKYPP